MICGLSIVGALTGVIAVSGLLVFVFKSRGFKRQQHKDPWADIEPCDEQVPLDHDFGDAFKSNTRFTKSNGTEVQDRRHRIPNRSAH